MPLGVISTHGFNDFSLIEPTLDKLDLPRNTWLLGGSYKKFDVYILELSLKRSWTFIVYDFNQGLTPAKRIAKQAERLMKGLLTQVHPPQPPQLLIFCNNTELGFALVAREAAELHGIPVILDTDVRDAFTRS